MPDDAVMEMEQADASGLSSGDGAARQDPVETFGVTCPECGGSLRVREGEKSIRCEYCGSALYVTRPKGVKRFILEPSISAGKARLEALHYLSSETHGRIKARHASIMDLELINVPFWRMNGTLMGWVCGEKITRKQVEVSGPGPHGQQKHYKTVEERAPYSRVVYKRVDWSSPACTLRHLGLQGVSLKAQLLDWDLFDHRLSCKLNIALPMKPVGDAEREGSKYLSGLVIPASSSTRASKFRMMNNELSIYYYPVYILRYRHAGIIYSITIDGCDGSVIRGDYPVRRPIDYRSMFFVPAAAAFLAGTWAPVIPIAAAAVYIYDLIHSGRFIPVHRWLKGRLESWFGGEL